MTRNVSELLEYRRNSPYDGPKVATPRSAFVYFEQLLYTTFYTKLIFLAE